ncbi:MAG: hypothetical protein IIZ25_06585 [Thermoguttaceae bacterium]|nr:hypothetical protein [Thermoguttaceae bacterium]
MTSPFFRQIAPAEKTEEYIRRLSGGLSRPREQAPAVPSTAIVGAGLMGCSIAAAFLRAGLPAALYDSSPEALARAGGRVAEELAAQLADGGEGAGAEARARVRRLLSVLSGAAELDRAGVIIETIVEKLKVKQKFYRQIEPLLSADKILLTNTSTLRIADLAEGLPAKGHLAPERFCGFHFFHPVRKRSLVEVIPSPNCAPRTAAAARRLAEAIDKRPITVGDGPGFLVNRLLNPYLDEAMALLIEGTPMEKIESAARRFGMEMGPFRIIDEIGLDVTMHSGWTFYKVFPERIAAMELLPLMVDGGRLGRKNGVGFYRYASAGNWADLGAEDPTLGELLASIRARWGSAYGIKRESGEDIIAARLFLGILREGERILEEGIVAGKDDVDRALVFALGFPAAKGGIFYWSDCFREELRPWRRELAALGGKFA